MIITRERRTKVVELIPVLLMLRCVKGIAESSAAQESRADKATTTERPGVTLRKLIQGWKEA